ncbi:MAG: diguanylate cyclase [bacterium]|nr:diguanylate cyclase [bacterium]
MNIEDIREVLKEFADSKEWNRIQEFRLRNIGTTTYWIIDNEGRFIFHVERNEGDCKNIKATSIGYENCQSAFLSSFYQTRKGKRPVMNKCHLKYITFGIPLIVEGEVIGIIGGCQIKDPSLINEGIKIKSSSIIRASQLNMMELLEREIELLTIHCQSTLDLIIKDRKLMEKDNEIKSISRFYKIFEEEKYKIINLEPHKLFFLVLDVVSRIISGQTYVLMLYNENENKLEIKLGIEEDGTPIPSSKLGIDREIAAYVMEKKESILIKNIGEDERFVKRKMINQYYTKSLLVVPLVLRRKIIGVVSLNSEMTRHIFNESELRVLELICGYIAVAIETSLLSQKEIKTKDNLEKEAEKLKKEALDIKAQTNALREQVSGLNKQIIEAEKLKEKAEELKTHVDKITEKTLFTKKFLELQSVEIVNQEEEAIKLKKNTELLAKQMEKYISFQETSDDIGAYAKDLKIQTENLHIQAGKLFSQVEMLKSQLQEAEELLLKVKDVEKLSSQAQELREQTGLLRSQINKLKNQAESLIVQAKEAEAIIVQVQEIERKGKVPEALNLFAEISSQVNCFQKIEDMLNWFLLKIQPTFNFSLGAYLYVKGKNLYGNIFYHNETPESLLQSMKDKLKEFWSILENKSINTKKIVFKSFKESFEGIYLEKSDQIESYLIVTLTIMNKDIGLIALGSTKKNAFEPKNKKLLSCLSEYISLSMEKNEYIAKAKTWSNIDELTKVYNLHYLRHALDGEIKRAKTFKHAVSLIMLDVDNLAKINTHYGHFMGDKVLIKIARILKESIEEISLVARYGNNRFTVILPETEEEQACKIAEKIRSKISSVIYSSSGSKFNVTVSVGVASYSKVTIKRVDELFRSVNKALTKAKRAGRNVVEVYNVNN